MTLRTRLAFGLLSIGLVVVVPLLIALHSLKQVKSTITDVQNREFAASQLLGRIRTALDELRENELRLTINKDTTVVPALAQNLARLGATSDSLRRYGLDTVARGIENATRGMRQAVEEEARLYAADQPVGADALSDSVQARFAFVENVVLNGERLVGRRIAASVGRTADQSSKAEGAAKLAFALAALIATMIGVWLVRSISRPVRDLERGMNAVAGGEFGYRLRVAPSRRDEFGRLASSYHTMSAQLAELDKLKAEFVSVASHELKTPINVIGGYLQLLEEGVYGPLTPKQLEVCATLAAQCDSLARLVRQLLDVSRFEAGGGKIEPRRFGLPRFLDDLERAFHVLARQRDVQFVVTRAPGLPEEVTWDADRINEVLGNMLSNSFKFTPRGGTVELTAEPEEEIGVRLTVRDTGAGIPPAQLPHIFKKFYQADNQASASAKGTGLGLAISKEIVDAHGGTIAADSTLGAGTIFVIVLPVHVRLNRRSAPQQRIRAEAAV